MTEPRPLNPTRPSLVDRRSFVSSQVDGPSGLVEKLLEESRRPPNDPDFYWRADSSEWGSLRNHLPSDWASLIPHGSPSWVWSVNDPWLLYGEMIERAWLEHINSSNLQELPKSSRLERRVNARRKKVAKAWAPPEAHRVRFCGSPLPQEYVDNAICSGSLPAETLDNVLLTVGEDEKGNRSASFRGIARCGAVWMCPECSAKIRHERAVELGYGLDNFFMRRLGKVTALFETYTISHNKNTPLAAEKAAITKALSSVNNRRAVVTFRRDHAFLGSVSCWDETWGAANGWHLHVHKITFFDCDLTDDDIDAYTRSLKDIYGEQVKKCGMTCNDLRGVVVERVENGNLARYVTKAMGLPNNYDAAAELTRTDKKRGREGRFTPFEFLDHPDDPRFKALWVEHVRAMKGARCCSWSRGLREKLGVGPDVDVLELMERDARKDVYVFAEIPRELYALTWFYAPSNLIRAQELAEQNDPEGVAAAFGCRDFLRIRRNGHVTIRLLPDEDTLRHFEKVGTPLDMLRPHWNEHKFKEDKFQPNRGTLYVPDVGDYRALPDKLEDGVWRDNHHQRARVKKMPVFATLDEYRAHRQAEKAADPLVINEEEDAED